MTECLSTGGSPRRPGRARGRTTAWVAEGFRHPHLKEDCNQIRTAEFGRSRRELLAVGSFASLPALRATTGQVWAAWGIPTGVRPRRAASSDAAASRPVNGLPLPPSGEFRSGVTPVPVAGKCRPLGSALGGVTVAAATVDPVGRRAGVSGMAKSFRPSAMAGGGRPSRAALAATSAYWALCALAIDRARLR